MQFKVEIILFFLKQRHFSKNHTAYIVKEIIIMKKVLTALLAMLVVITFSVNAIAAIGDDLIITPYWNYMDSIEVDVNFLSNTGKATATITRIYGVTTSLEATLSVYKKVGSDWTFIDSTSGSSTRTLGLELDFNAESGVTYKAVVDVTAYGNGGSETDTAEKIKTCP